MSLPQAFIDYRETLPKTSNGRGVLYTIETFATAIPLRHKGYQLMPGQEWKGNKAKYWLICPHHPNEPFQVRANNFLLDNEGRGPGCEACRADIFKDKSRALVGTTNSDGVTALEVEWRTVKKKGTKNGTAGAAFLRCRCPHCANEDHWVAANSFQKPGKVTCCPRCSTTGAINPKKLKQEPEKANRLVEFYLTTVGLDEFLKVGLAVSTEHRARGNNYEGELFVSEPLPLSWVWTAEQILKFRYRPKGFKPEKSVMKHGGHTELLPGWIDDKQVVSDFHSIINEIRSLDGDWETVFNKHRGVKLDVIPVMPTIQLDLSRMVPSDATAFEQARQKYLSRTTTSTQPTNDRLPAPALGTPEGCFEFPRQFE